ncbi:uncharacterized protein LOC126354598 [Schistocerca gregaria]|uniref:uncharacterized protein LOC126354598 n=1 Tax=Schistocerca gregaria TaxID=7010 RepID=UPI00211E44F0|nr:uncharacterized protein LOC126354598 [Schistocerca gregaria]
MRLLCGALICLLVIAEAVLLQDEEDIASIQHHRSKYLPAGFTDAVHMCLAGSQEGGWPAAAGVRGILPCVGRGALAALSAADAEERVQLADGVTLSGGGGGGAARTLLEDAGAGGVQSLLDASAAVLGRRALSWDMADLLPGLALRYSPPHAAAAAAYAVDPVNAAGVVEFVMVRRQHPHDFDVRSIGLGQLMLRQALLPFLLGLKVPVAALIPVMLAGLALLAKKALLLAKVALLVAGLAAAGSLLRPQQQQYQQQQVLHDSPHSLYPSFFRGVNYGVANGERAEDVDSVRDGRSVSGGARNFAWE